ncbi:MAG: SDR family NAD(P)-dependent oxidoreductase [Bacillota bacterium]
MIDIQGKWALVTGASRGVGEQIARALADKGVNLILHSRSTEHTHDLREELNNMVKVHELAADLANPEAAIELAKRAEKISGGIDILYNNAAISVPWREDYAAPIEEYQKVFNVNVISLIKICDVIMPEMRKRGFGRIINLTSGIEDQPELTPYAISKAAVDKYVKDFAIKLEGANVLMNLLDPGWLRTDLGGQQAPNSPETVIPGALVPALLEKEEGSGKLYRAQDYS